MTKRKSEECCVDCDNDSNSSSDGSTSVATKGCLPSKIKRPKRSVNFDGVTVYYFKRAQGFMCVPSEGGSTLGMSTQHTHVENFSLSEYTKAQKSTHKMVINEHKNNGIFGDRSRGFEKSILDGGSDSDSASDLEVDDCYFLQPVPIRQRRMMLRCSGVKKIEISESDGCKDIRQSREVCGCDCRGVCNPDTCSCSGAGIKCQVDRLSFPCSCTKTGCGNKSGRVEFNPFRVRTHFVHTLMRMDLEKGSVVDDKKADVRSSDSDDSVDLTEFNSNEKGSCRDCQQSEVCQILMHEAERQYSEMKPTCASLPQNYAHSAASMLPSMPLNDTLTHVPNNRVLMFNENSSDFYNGVDTTSNSLFDYSNNASNTSYTTTTDNPVVNQPSPPVNTYPPYTPDTTHNISSYGCSNVHINNLSPVSGKFLDITGPPGFKLEPISTLNSHPFPSTTLSQGTNYNRCPPRPTPMLFPRSRSFPLLASETSYTTMTDTTSDQIATTCPGISTHLRRQSQPEVITELSPLASLSNLNPSDDKTAASSLNADVVAALFSDDLDSNIDEDDAAMFTPNLGPIVKAIIEQNDDPAEISHDNAQFPQSTELSTTENPTAIPSITEISTDQTVDLSNETQSRHDKQRSQSPHDDPISQLDLSTHNDSLISHAEKYDLSTEKFKKLDSSDLSGKCEYDKNGCIFEEICQESGTAMA